MVCRRTADGASASRGSWSRCWASRTFARRSCSRATVTGSFRKQGVELEMEKCFLKSITRMTPLQKAAVLLVIGLLFYGSLIAINELAVKPNIHEMPYNTDVDIFRNRTSAI